MASRFFLALALLFGTSPLYLFAQAGSPALSTLILSGKVVADNGTPPAESVTIQSECNGQQRAETYTDSKGFFVFEMGSAGKAATPGLSLAVEAAMSEISQVGSQYCEVWAELSGHISEKISLNSGQQSGFVNLGTLRLRQRGLAQGSKIDVNSLAIPAGARKDFEKGQKEARKGRWAAARQKFQKAIALFPKYAMAWLELGRVQARASELTQARESFHEALAADKNLEITYVELADLAAREGQWQELAEITERSLEVNPVGSPPVWFFNAAANYNLHRFDRAERSVLRGLDQDSQHRLPQMEYLLGLILATKHEYTSASEHIRNYLRLAPNASDAPNAQKQLAQFESFSTSVVVGSK